MFPNVSSGFVNGKHREFCVWEPPINRGIFEKSRVKVWLFRNKYVPLHPQVRDLAQLVAHTSGGREVAGSSPVIPTREGRL